MNADQIRVRVTVTVTKPDGRASRSSLVERSWNLETSSRVRSFLESESKVLFDRAFAATVRGGTR